MVYVSRKVGGPFDQHLMDELSTPTVTYLSNGRMQVESKDKMRARGASSPDMADAFCLTFARTGAAASGAMTEVRGARALSTASSRGASRWPTPTT